MTERSGPRIAPRAIRWFDREGRDLPWRDPDFPPWGILVSEFMLQQTPVARVVPRLTEWLERWPTPADLAAVPAGEAVRAWRNLGYPRRALNLHAAATAIVERHGGIVPAELDELLALPGVGPYTARAVAAFAFGMRHPVVDVNVRRVLARAIQGRAEPGPPRTTADLALMAAQLPAEASAAQRANAAIMELGALVCTARQPACERCPIATQCAWLAAGRPEFTGRPAPKQKAYLGSDRHVRGLVLAELRASDTPVPLATLGSVWSDAEQLERAIASLRADGLVVAAEGGLGLPGESKLDA